MHTVPTVKVPAAKVLSHLRHPCRSRQEPRVYEIAIQVGERAWDPTSTQRLVVGPASLRYEQYADGGVNLTVTR